MIKKAYLRPRDILWATLTFGSYMTVTFIFFQKLMNSKVFYVLTVGFYMIRLVGLNTAALTIVMNIINRNKLTGMLKQFAEFDHNVSVK